jgi:hypothetical protein
MTGTHPAVGRTLHRHPDHADLGAAVAIVRDQRCRVGTDQLACGVVEFHDAIVCPETNLLFGHPCGAVDIGRIRRGGHHRCSPHYHTPKASHPN